VCYLPITKLSESVCVFYRERVLFIGTQFSILYTFTAGPITSQSCSRGGGRRVEDMCYERRRAEGCVDESAHHSLELKSQPLIRKVVRGFRFN
jgi:hypothetical protein